MSEAIRFHHPRLAHYLKEYARNNPNQGTGEPGQEYEPAYGRDEQGE